MRYRRYGRTELKMPVMTIGGMRYQASWSRDETDKITDENQANLEATVRYGLEHGMTHIETARGYGTSEVQLGRALQGIPRDSYILQTKIGPTETGEEFAQQFAESLECLQTEYVDLLGIHGINNQDVAMRALMPGGAVDVAEQLVREGKVRHLGFSTHGPVEDIVPVIQSNRFSYVNLHWFWVRQDRWPAIREARRRDMGVFIISPNDKGGKLYDPPAKLVELCRPLSPMVWNSLFCLRSEDVHTLSIGAANPEQLDPAIEAADRLGDPETPKLVAEITARLDAEMASVLGADWVAGYLQGLPPYHVAPGQVAVAEVLRLWSLAKALDMVEYGKMRYNLLGSGGHWFPGLKVDKLEGRDLSGYLMDSPFADRIPGILEEAHEMFAGEDVKRLQRD